MTEIYLTPLQNPGKNIYTENNLMYLLCWILVILLPKWFLDSQMLVSVTKVHGVLIPPTLFHRYLIIPCALQDLCREHNGTAPFAILRKE